MKYQERFLAVVTGQIRSKEARIHVEKELDYHLKETKKYWMDKGMTEIEAEEKAVKQMGDPQKLGVKMNKLHRPKADWLLLSLLASVMVLGILPILALEETYGEVRDSFLQHKVIFGMAGLALAVGIMFFDYRRLQRWGWVFFLIGAAILSALRWFPNTFINGEPSFYIPGVGALNCWAALPFFFLAWAQFFQDKRIKAWQLILLFVYSLYLFLMIPNLSITFIYGMMVMIMLWWSHLSKRIVFSLTAGTFTLGTAGIASLYLLGRQYQIQRVEAFIDPKQYANGAGYMYVQLRERMLEARWFGESVKQLSPIPDLHTDYALVGLTSHFGYAASITVMLVLLLFVIRMGAMTMGVKSQYAKLLVVGAVALFSLQFFYNIAMIFGLVPIISMSLPFISYGGMPTIFNAFLIGVVLSVYRRKQFTVLEEEGCKAK